MATTKKTTSTVEDVVILRQIIDIINSELELTSVLSEVVHIITEVTKAESVFIYLFDESREHLVLMASKTPHKKELGRIILKVGEGITGWVAKENKPVAIKENAYKDGRFKHFDLLPEDRYEAFLSTPIIYKKQTVGVINVQFKKAHPFPQELVDLLFTVAKQISGAIVNAQLFEETKKKALQFDSLVKVSHSITSEAYLDEILNLIVVVTAEMLNSKICSIMLFDKKKNELIIKATQSLSDAYRKKPNLKVSSSVSGHALVNKQPVSIYDVRKDERYYFRDIAVQEHLTSMLTVPMIFKDEAIGVINVYTKEPHVFTAEEISVLQMVSNQAAVAVENTKLMDEADKAKEALETRKLVERAKSVLMRMGNLTEEQAHKMIHKKSMDSCKTMKDVAESILLMDEIDKVKNKK
ncbi:MAG: GAF domain-containing protein [Candidatus Omnitrophica bacterium]|nr:GAF domain-containing protein [Candidatus Omnitrophota bacterium]